MYNYDEEMQRLRLQMEQKKHTELKLKELHMQHESLKAKVDALKMHKLEEQADVERLEGHSLAAFFYGVIGKTDEKLDKEREEAYAAAVKYDAAARELHAVEEDIKRYELELDALRECGQQYEQMRQNKLAALKALGSRDSEQILHMQEHISYLDGQIKEIKEALEAGYAALETTDVILSSLNSAEGWGTWDLLGGGLLSDLVKHSRLDDAQRQVEHLQVQLRRFKTELTDITISADIQVSIDGFLFFADYFFDGLFADWLVLDKINQSQSQVQKTKHEIEQIINRLNAMHDAVEESLEAEKAIFNDLITTAKI